MIQETIKNNLDELDEIFEEDFEEDFRMSKADAEILCGILVDIEKGVNSEDTIRNIIQYILKRNGIAGFDGQNVSFELDENDNVNIIKR